MLRPQPQPSSRDAGIHSPSHHSHHSSQHKSGPSLSDFKQLALLGEGAYSAVYKVKRLADGEVYALKKVKLPQLSDKEKQNALNEIRLLASIEHDNVVAYKEAFFDDKSRCLCIVQECADAGDLLQHINSCKKERCYLRETDVWRWLGGMVKGLKALHDLKILHRDMKCANVFLSSSQQGTIAKLGDFNVSKVAKRGLCMTQTGTPYYASPEVWRDMPYDAKSDMWSLGCILYEMLALKPPFRAEDMEGLYRKVVRGQYSRIPGHFSQDIAEVVAVLLQVHARHRPNCDQLLQMPVIQRNVPGLKLTEPDFRQPSDLLGTIKLPKNAIDLSGCLPKPRYELSRMTTPAGNPTIDEHSPGSPGAPLPSESRRWQGGGLPPPPPQRRNSDALVQLPVPGNDAQHQQQQQQQYQQQYQQQQQQQNQQVVRSPSKPTTNNDGSDGDALDALLSHQQPGAHQSQQLGVGATPPSSTQGRGAAASGTASAAVLHGSGSAGPTNSNSNTMNGNNSNSHNNAGNSSSNNNNNGNSGAVGSLPAIGTGGRSRPVPDSRSQRMAIYGRHQLGEGSGGGQAHLPPAAEEKPHEVTGTRRRGLMPRLF